MKRYIKLILMCLGMCCDKVNVCTKDYYVLGKSGNNSNQGTKNYPVNI